MAREDVARKKRKYVKKDKKARRNRKGWMDGARENTMLPYVPQFAQAVDTGWQAAEVCFKHILNVYHFHFPYTLPDDEEPAILEEYDAKKATAANDESKLSQEELIRKRAIINEQNKCIRRWLLYRATTYRKHLRKLTKRNANDTYEIFMARLCGITKAPKQPHAVHMFLREKKDVVASEVASAWQAKVDKKTEKPPVAFYDKMARDMLKKVPPEEAEKYKTMAIDEGNKEKELYKKRLTEPPSKRPEDRAAAVANLKGFLGDVQRGCEERTFLRIFSLVGGPMSETGGEINTFNVVVSKSNADVPLTFPEFWGDEKMTELVNAYKDYLVTCYSSEDKKSVIVAKGALTGAGTLETSAASTSGAETSPTVPTAPVEARSGDMIDITSVDGLRSLFEDMSDDDDSSDSSDSDESDGEEMAEETKKRKRRAKSKSNATAVKRPKKMVDAAQPNKDKDKENEIEDAPAQSEGPRRSNYEIERDRLIVRKDVALIGLSDYHAKGLPTEGVEWEEYIKRGFELIASGQARDPALPPPSPPPKARPKPRQRTTASTSTDTRRLRSSTAANVSTSVNTINTSPGTSEMQPNGEMGAGMEEGDVSAGKEVCNDMEHGGEDGTMEGMGVDPIDTEGGVVPRPLSDKDAAGSADATNQSVRAKVNALKSDAPCWLQDAVAEFADADGGDEMLPLLVLLLEIEREHGWVSVEKGKAFNLPGKRMRPSVLSAWINNGRTRNAKRIVLDEAEATKLVTAWESWYPQLQEVWRVRDEDGRWRRDIYGDEWKKLMVPGQNGLLSVVGVLSWWTSFCWKATVSKEEPSLLACAEARADLEWVMKGLLVKLTERQVTK